MRQTLKIAHAMYRSAVRFFPLTVAALFLSLSLTAQKQRHQGFAHQQSAADGYEWPTDPKVLDRLEEWRDMKFGVLFHYGLYSIPGIVESWSICSEDVDWINRPNDLPYDEYKQWYWNFKDSIAPVNLNAAEWADIMADAGMKYMIFTTKHHDGFCTFDSKLTDFTLANGPFRDDPRRDMAKTVFDAFRDKGFGVGCYFSKPDWHCQWFWNDAYATPNRRINYKQERHPDWWRNYQDFTAGQLHELLDGGYGRFDILWLDGGWIAGDDIGLDSILADVRSATQPGIISVDRSIRGRNENYQTPERGIPATQLDYPWESCIPLSNDWGWVPDAPFKSPQKVIAMLAETVAKGGCLLLGVGPTADGRIEPEVRSRLAEIGKWLRANGEAIYSTRNVARYNDGDVWFTGSKDGKTVYAIYTPAEDTPAPRTLTWRGNIPEGKMTLLANGQSMAYKTDKDGNVTVALPKGMKPGPFALKFRLKDELPIYKDAAAAVSDRVADLLSRMTLDEKAGQLLCPMGWEMVEKRPDGSVAISEEFRRQNSGGMPVGSYWAVLRADPWTQRTLETGLSPRQGAEALNALQRFAVDSTRLGIPILFAEETPHGHMALGATVMPTGLGLSSTWNPDLIRKAGKTVGDEALSVGASVGYGPVLDIARDPRWSRMEETFGEDPYLTGEMGTAYMSGLQSADACKDRKLFSTLKHFAAYGVPESGINGAPANVGMRQLLTELLPPFEKAVKEGVGSIMTSYNSIDGIPASGHRELLTDILRGEWGFDGVVFSDLFSIDGMGGKTAANRQEAGAQAIQAGVDIDLGAACYGSKLADAVRKGLVPEAALDSAVSHVLRMKFEAGLFEHPYVDSKAAERFVGSAAAKDVARQVAREGIVLLKNDGILPISPEVKKIAVIGPNADNIYNQLGDYTAPQPRAKISTTLDGIRTEGRIFNENATQKPMERIFHENASRQNPDIIYSKGCAVRDTLNSDIPSAVDAARNSDIAILVLGGSSARDFETEYIATGAASVESGKPSVSDMDCGEGFDRATLSLLGDQQKLLEAVLATGTPTVVIYIQGRPLDMNLAAEKADALLCAWYPGEEGGAGVADVLFGACDASGRLPVTIPCSVGQLPMYYSQGQRHDYVELFNTPLYPFGHGLSYTDFNYSNLCCNVDGDADDPNVTISCDITNTGEREGSETAQLYLHDDVASVVVPPILLKGFEKVTLKPGETRTVTFRLGKGELSVLGPDMTRRVEPGSFTFFIGPSSAIQSLEGSFTID